MMITVVDHREPSEPSQPGHPERTGGPDVPEPIDAEPIDAEVVDSGLVDDQPPERSPAQRAEEPRADGGGHSDRGSHSGGGAPPGEPRADDDAYREYREYQQFLEFQRFREMRRQYGDAPTAPEATPGGRRPWYRRALRLLRFKAVRRLLYLLVLVLVLMYLYNSMFGGGGGQASNGASPGPSESESTVLQRSPSEAVRAVYDELANRPDTVCLLFDSNARRSFAAAHDADNCRAAAQRLNERVTDKVAYKNLDIGRDAARRSGDSARISSCDLAVNGGPRLGVFRLRQQPSGGWKIDGYARANCES